MGDSITGYNNFGDDWPLVTYPDFLQELLDREGKPHTVVNGGQAGALSDVAGQLTEEYLRLFPSSTHFIFGFGTNDLAGIDEDTAEVGSAAILRNIGGAKEVARRAGKTVLAFNIPYLNANRFGKGTGARSRRIRDYHNEKLAAFCAAQHVLLADVCSGLKDEHFADALHPNEAGARIIAEAVGSVLFADTGRVFGFHLNTGQRERFGGLSQYGDVM